jgi:hypothetical protein
MNKKSSKSGGIKRGNKAAIVATMLAVPMISTPAMVYGQKGETPAPAAKMKRAENSYLKFANLQHKIGSESVTILGVGDGNTIYEKPNGSKFYIDPRTGDMKPVSEKHWIKMTTSTQASVDMFIKLDGVKGESAVKLVGVDADGSVIHQRPDGTQFKVHQKTGHITLMK